MCVVRRDLIVGPDSIGLGDAIASGVRKLLAAVPDPHRGQSLEVASRIVVDPHGWLPQPDALQPGEAFATVQADVFARQRLQLTYRSRQAARGQELVVEPHGLVSAGSDWYLCASAGGTERFFKAARIEHAALLAEPCSGPELDVVHAWRDHRARFLDQFTPVSVDAWVRADRWDDAREWSIRSSLMDVSGNPPGEGWRPVRWSPWTPCTRSLSCYVSARTFVSKPLPTSKADFSTTSTRSPRCTAPDPAPFGHL